MGSEQNSAVLHANDNLQKALNIEIHGLNIRQKFVECRINAEQRVIYSRFQSKIRWSQLQHARINGDMETARKLRLQEREQMGLSDHRERKTYKDMLERTAADMLQTGDFGPVEMRPWTACAMLRSKTPSSRRSETTPKPPKSDIDEDEIDGYLDPIVHENEPPEILRKPDAVLVTEKVKSARMKRSQSIAKPTSSVPSPRKDKEFKSLMQFGNEEPTLLEVHKEVVEKKQYPKRINKLNLSIEPLLSTDADLCEDYSLVMWKTFTAMNSRKPGFDRFDTTFTPEEERRKCVGDLTVPNLTMKYVKGLAWQPAKPPSRRPRAQSAKI